MRYEVIEYSGDYSWMVIASRDRRYMWVLSRNKDLPPELLDGLFNRLKSSEFDISAIIKQAKKS
jgi:apolipoprotein D and lipocalin family protein